MRLIDADALTSKIIKAQFSYTADAMDIIDDIYAAPTIEAAPVVHGKWVEAMAGEMHLYPYGQKMCSMCKTVMPSTWKKMPPFCFGCGAKMGGGADCDE